jgi:serine/threonine protein kinase
MVQRARSKKPKVPFGLQETRPLSDDHYPTPGVSTGSHEVPEELVDHPRYEILGLLGAGGMGVVYKAQHRLMQRIVALKIMHPSLLRRPEMIERFRREVRTAAQLTHPNIVHAYDAEQWRHTHFLVMESRWGCSMPMSAG